MITGVVLLSSSLISDTCGVEMAQLRGRNLISFILDKIQLAAPSVPIAILATTAEIDDALNEYCRRCAIPILRGYKTRRDELILDCIDRTGWDFFVFLDSRDIFIETASLRDMIAIASTGAFDFVTNVPENTFPRGADISIIRAECYREGGVEFRDIGAMRSGDLAIELSSTKYSSYVYRNSVCPAAASLDLKVSDGADFYKAESIIKRIGSYDLHGDLCHTYSLLTQQWNNVWHGVSGPLLIAEIGGNHEGNFSQAKRLTELAIASGVDCVKFQIYTGATLVSPVESPDRHRHFQKFELTREQHIHLAEMCRNAGVAYAASVWDLQSLDWIDEYLTFYKVGSGDLTAWPLLEELARRGKPILLSTGLSTLDEILQTVRLLQRINRAYINPEMLCILQCTSMYPIPDQDANLTVMDTLRSSTRVSVGYSDHTTGIDALLVAASMGANVLEFHFTDSRENKEFRDHKVSLVPSEVRHLRNRIQLIVTLRGSEVKLPQASEQANNHEISFRRSVYLNKVIEAGDLISADDLVYLRPAVGTDARDAVLVVGATALRNLTPFKSIVKGVDYLPCQHFPVRFF